MRCSICKCKSLKAIELSLDRGLTQAKVAAKYRVSASSLARHARNCMRSRKFRMLELHLRLIDAAIRSTAKSDKTDRLRGLVDTYYDLMDRLEPAGGSEGKPMTILSVEYESRASRAPGRDEK